MTPPMKLPQVRQVAAAAARYLAPSRSISVVLGDADRIEGQLAALTTVERGAA